MDMFWIVVAVAGVAMLAGAGIGFYNGYESGYDAGTVDAVHELTKTDLKKVERKVRGVAAYNMINNSGS